MWAVKILFVMVLAVLSLNLLGVKGNSLKVTHAHSKNNPTGVDYPQELKTRYAAFSRGTRSLDQDINGYSTTKTQLCGRRLLETMIAVCNSPLGRGPRRRSQRASSTIPTLSKPGSREESEEDMGGERFEDLQEEERMDELSGLRHMKRSSFTPKGKLPRDVVEECCNRAHQGCSTSQLVKYCIYLPAAPGQEVTTPAPTTTTAPPTSQFRSHRLIRMKMESPSVPRTEKSNEDFSSSTTVEEIRQQIIHEAIQCLFNPECYRMVDSDENVILPPPPLSNALPQRSRFPNSPRFIPSGKNKSVTNNSSSSKSKTPLGDLCSSRGSKTRSKSRRLQRRRKQEEETSRLIPLILQILAWYTSVSPVRQPELEDTSVMIPSPREQDATTTTGGSGANQGPNIRPSNANLKPATATTGRRYNPDDIRDLGDRKSQMTVYTDPPYRTRYVQFPLGTNDGITYRH